jgi:hypothetical protein
VFSTFDISGIVYVSKGFDRNLVKEQIENNVFSNFRIDNIEYAQPIAASNVLREITKVEGVEYVTIEYFGKDFQLYDNFTALPKYAFARNINNIKAENVVARWTDKAAFKITLDGCTVAGVNYDGQYLIIVGNNWTDGNYDSLRDSIISGFGGSGGFAQAIPLEFGKEITDINPAVSVRHYNGVFEIFTVDLEEENIGPSVLIKLEDPENVFLRGYQAFNASEDIFDGSYLPSTIYSFQLNINGSGLLNYELTSPASGNWILATIASAINNVIPATASAGIDDSGFIRITSTNGGSGSTITMAAGLTGEDLVALLSGVALSVFGSDGYLSCLGSTNAGTLNILPGEYFGTEREPDIEIDYFNYQTTITALYNEILSISDNFFINGSNLFEDQRHGIIFDYVEAE